MLLIFYQNSSNSLQFKYPQLNHLLVFLVYLAVMNEATLIFPHQLFKENPALDKNRRVFLIEDPLFFGDVRYPMKFNKKKLDRVIINNSFNDISSKKSKIHLEGEKNERIY